MALKQLTVTEAARNFSELISRVHYQGDSALLFKGGKPVVKVIPAHRPNTGAQLAVLWPKRVPLGREEAGRLERELKASRRRLRPLASKWE